MKQFLNSSRGKLVAGGAVALLALVAAWFLVVAPQRSKASDLQAQVESAQSDLATKRAALARPAAAIKVKAADTYRLTKALPDRTDMSGVLLDISRLAKKHGLDGQAAKVTCDVTLNVDNGAFSLAAELKVALPGADKAKLQALIEDAHSICPYSKATRNNVPVKLTAV